MGKPQTLRLNKEFRTLYYHGRSQVSPLLITYVRKNRLGECRIGITTGKKIGCAVRRNRARRVIRAAFAPYAPLIGGFDIVFVARKATAECKSTELSAVMKKQFRSLGLL